MNEYLVREKLVLKVYTIGYEPMGESVVFLIVVDNSVKFCGVVDCYEKNKINKVIEILEENRIDKIDFICLTHPDIDHCIGWTKLLDKVDCRTTIAYPINLLNFIEKYRVSVQREITKLAEIFKYRNNSNQKPKLKACSDTKNIISDIYFKDSNTGLTYSLIIDTYSPITTIIDRYSANKIIGEEMVSFCNNDFSIMMAIGVGDYKLLLGGDTENTSILQINNNLNSRDRKFFSDVIDYVKIPHHASNNSDKMEDLLCDVRLISNSVTTVYRTSKLPNSEIINFYKKKSNSVYCTGNILKSKNEEKYGIVEFDVDILNSTVKETLIANAVEL